MMLMKGNMICIWGVKMYLLANQWPKATKATNVKNSTC